MRLRSVLAFLCTFLLTAPVAALAQPPDPPPDPGATGSEAPRDGLAAPDGDRLRLRADLLVGWAHDGANAPLGFEKQGRVGYAILTLEGRVHRRVRYRVAVNPVDEVAPLPACGEPDFFFPNDPRFLYDAGPRVPCDPKNGHRRVDGYRGIALDVVPQQGPMREAWVELALGGGVALRIGRQRLPLGFDWEEAGSMSAKDAPRIQRINAEASFGALFTYRRGEPATRPRVAVTIGGVLGEGNRWWDYDYFYFEDTSLDANSAQTAVLSVVVSPAPWLEVRGAGKRGFTGSKVERLPSYWASKRHDHAVILGAELRPAPRARILGEWARYRWGPTVTSAEMLGVDPAPIDKTGAWITAEVWHPARRGIDLGASVTYEVVDRADSLVKYMAAAGLYRVETGRRDRWTAVRVFADAAGGALRIGLFRTLDGNPYPWLSGIWPVEGDRAFTGRAPDKYGVMFRVRVR